MVREMQRDDRKDRPQTNAGGEFPAIGCVVMLSLSARNTSAQKKPTID
jgi:hypothetical protein